MDETFPDKQGIRVLALDGGGIRGLSSLLLLRELMQRIAVQENTSATLRPSDYFELIIGTGTGGISALFVGRMHMTVDEAIEAYLWLATEGFRTPSVSLIARWLNKETSIDGDSLTKILGDIVQKSLGDRDAQLQEPRGIAGARGRSCHTAVLATSSTDPPYIFRSHPTSHPASTNAIHEVARATLATARIFPPISLGIPPIEFIDYSAGYNNPCDVAVNEVSRVWPGAEISCLVSLGTGLQNAVRVGRMGKDAMAISRRIAEDCEQVHYRFLQRKHRDGLQYTRLNVTRGLSDTGVMEWDRETSETAGVTEAYVHHPDVDFSLRGCVIQMIGGTPHTPINLDVQKSQAGPHDFRIKSRFDDGVNVTVNSVPFSKESILCLDGQISNRSQYAVASGGYADIWKGSLGGQIVAIKVMRPFSETGVIETSKLIERLWREYLAWSDLSHPNILDCLGFSYDFTPQFDHQVPSLISPWMTNGTVLFYLKTHPNADRSRIILGIARGLSYLHDRKPIVVHGDLRAGNILVSDEGTPCLTDFGLSKVIGDTRGMTTSSNVAGSLRWMAPELFLRGAKVSSQSDVWAYGMTLLEIFTGKPPFHDVYIEPAVLNELLNGRVPGRPVPVDAQSLTDAIWMVCQKCWRIDSSQRPRMSDVYAELSIVASQEA